MLARLRHRIPVRVRHYWKLLAVCVAFVAVLTTLVSTVRVRPYVTSSGASGGDVTVDIAGTKDLFDAGAAHSMTLTFRDDDYQRLLDSFYKQGEKDFLEADITIDGTMVPSVGIRLKGNSTLAGLTRDGQARQGGFGGPGGAVRAGPAAGAPPGGAPAGGAPPDGFPGGGPPGGAPGGGAPGGGAPGGGGAAGGPEAGGFGRSAFKAEEPETLPWLIRFDEFVDGRRYQGHRDIAVRVSGGIGGGSSTVLNEALSLAVLDSAGQVAQRYSYTSFTVNDRPTTARLIVENPDEHFAATELGASGVLYKSLASGRFTDQGDDPTAYGDDFDQITGKGSQDLQPLIDLIRWVDNSSDAEFDARLADHVDVDSFARYVAAQNLLLNFDDMAGPGRNYYLWYDLTTKKFTVVGWDYNLTFTGGADQGPHDAGRGGPGEGVLGGAAPPDGVLAPEGAPQPGGNVAGGPPGGPRGMGGHKLKERFLASSAFTTAYENAYRRLYQQMFANGAATNALTGLARVLSTVDGADQQAVTTEIERLRTLVRQRTTSLATDEVITSR